MTDDISKDPAPSAGMRSDGAERWEYKVIRVTVGTITFQRYGPDSFPFEETLNELGAAGWEAFHVQAFAEGDALLLFLKRRLPAAF